MPALPPLPPRTALAPPPGAFASDPGGVGGLLGALVELERAFGVRGLCWTPAGQRPQITPGNRLRDLRPGPEPAVGEVQVDRAPGLVGAAERQFRTRLEGPWGGGILRWIAAEDGAVAGELIPWAAFWIGHHAEASQRQREHATARLGERAAALVHDLRNRLTLIGLQQERFFLEGGGSDNAVGRELLAEARALCAAMLPQAGRTSAATPLKLREVLERALRQAPGMSRSGGRGVEMRLRCRPDLEVFADPVALARVFENLLVNAVDACRGGGRISLDAQARAGGVAIVVEDTGCGMDRAALARAYRPGAHGGGGTGYGSVSLLAALEDLAAELFVQSAPGQGTRCEVRLAAAPEPDGIWLVDPDARRLARRAARLTRQGRRVLPMAGCGEAMRLLGDLRPRSLWLARGMGDPLLGELLRLAQGLDVPVGLCGEGRDWAPQVG